jgi:ABC-2 type transport system permease protein
MQKLFALVRRDLIAYFSSPLAYIVITAFLVMQGVIFYLILAILNDPMRASMFPLEIFFGGSIFFWLFLLFVVPVITMRLVAEERRSGTLEVLLTSPLSEAHVIIGKFVAAMVFYVALWLPTVIYMVILERFGSVDLGPVLSGYLGVFLLGFLFLGIGTFTSTLTNNQIIAAILAFAVLVILFSVGLVEGLITSGSWLKDVIGYMNLWTHMDDFAKGIVDSRHVVYELSVGLLFLFFATTSLSLKRGR